MKKRSDYLLPVKIDKGSGDVLVLLHGLGNNHNSWKYVLEALDYTKNRVIVVDLLGFGNAPKPDVKYTPEDHAKAVIATLGDLDVRKCTLVGHSMGCIIAVKIAKDQPEIVKDTVLLGAPLYQKIPKGNWWSKFTRAEGAYFTSFSFITKHPDATITTINAADSIAPFMKGMEVTEETWPAYRNSLRHTIMQTDSYKELLTINTPTLLVHGKLDMFVIKRTLKRLARKNKKHIKFVSTLGPHEITPLQGKKIAEILQAD